MLPVVEIPKPCPACGRRGHLTLAVVLAARPVGAYSLAGVQNKAAAQQHAELRCAACAMALLGRVEGNDFVADTAPPWATS